MTSEIKDNVWFVDGEPFTLISGAYHYFRIPRDLWESSLTQLKDAGFNTISTYIPWIWHEINEGQFDFEGNTVPERNLAEFISIVKRLGYKLVVRPGPYIFAEYAGYGIPDWLREEYPEILQVESNGKIYKEVTVRHPSFLKKVKKWYDALFDQVLLPFIEDGTIIAIQPDNEAGELLVANTNKRDHNPYTLRQFINWLKEKYNSAIDALNRVWKSSFKDFSKIRPPHGWIRPELKEEFADWHEFLEKYVAKYLRTLKNMIQKKVQEKGVNVPIFFNDPSFPFSPISSYDKMTIAQGPVFPDIYAKFFGHSYTFDLPFMGSYTSHLFKNFLLDWPQIITELQCGWFDPSSNVSNAQTIQLAMQLIAHGVCGFNWYLIADCREVDGSEYIWKTAIDLQGEKTTRFDAVKKVNEFVLDNKELLLNSKEVHDPIAIVEYLSNNRMISQNPTDAVVDFSQYGLMGMILSAGYDPEVLTLETLTTDDLLKYKLVFMVSKGFMDQKNFQKLFHYVERGGALIVLPEIIKYDQNGVILKGYEKLFPAEPIGSDLRLRVINRPLAYLKTGLSFAKYALFDRSKIKHKDSLFVLDSMHILINAIHNVFNPSEVLRLEPKGTMVRGHALTLEFDKRVNVEPFLSDDKDNMIGYVNSYGNGKIIVLGTIVGAPFITWRYYEQPEERHSEYLNFIDQCLIMTGIERKIAGCEYVETVARIAEDCTLFFLINRGISRSRTFKIPDLEHFNLGNKEEFRVDVIFSNNNREKYKAVDSQTFAKEEFITKGVQLPLDTDEVVVLKIS
ncbi:MAG: beta-galactosidase [Promethearchaeota archaeon]